MNENEIALSSLNAEELKLSVGDTLDLNVNGKKVKLRRLRYLFRYYEWRQNGENPQSA